MKVLLAGLRWPEVKERIGPGAGAAQGHRLMNPTMPQTSTRVSTSHGQSSRASEAIVGSPSALLI